MLKLELPALATTAPALMWSANRLLTQLQIWLQARQRGVLALELEWTLDLKRLNGVHLPPHQQLTLRTGRPTQDTAHLRRLASEHLARATLAAPASQLRLRTLDTAPWAGASQSLLPEDRLQGERLHALVERLSARLGAAQVVVPVARADHRPEHMQHWQAACANPGTHAAPPPVADALYPPWLLPRPLALQVHHGQPQFQGPLRLLTRAQRIETGWWERPRPRRNRPGPARLLHCPQPRGRPAVDLPRAPERSRRAVGQPRPNPAARPLVPAGPVCLSVRPGRPKQAQPPRG